MKKILGLDLGTTSIGWALVNESQGDDRSNIIKLGVRLVPLSTDEENDFKKGKAITINADRTLKRGARRNLQRYKLRRGNLIEILNQNGFISSNSLLPENGKDSTHSIWRLRAKAVTEEVSLIDIARILITINKKRGYKSNRKTKDEGDGQAIDGMDVALHLYDNKLTPGQYIFEFLKEGKKHIPDFYRSDLKQEFDAVWNAQISYYPSVLLNTLKEELSGKNKGQTWKICEKPFEIEGIKLEGNRTETTLRKYELRSKALNKKIYLEHLAIVLQEINGQINGSSGYLGAISDRSKELYFGDITIGQYLYNQIKANPHNRLKNQVFYRQDYLDEFERIWETQSKFHSILTDQLRKEIRDKVIFYQRRLKSQKGLISVCELEGREKEVVQDGKKKKKIIGPRVIPKSSPLFQEFKIWQILNNIEITNIESNDRFVFDSTTKQLLFNELNTKGKSTNDQILKLVTTNYKKWELNFKDGIEGNHTNSSLLKAYQSISERSGHELNFSKMSASQIKESIGKVFDLLGIKRDILDFDSELEGKAFETQASYQLWHLLYSYEGDNSKSGNDKLYQKLDQKFGIPKEYATSIISVVFQDDYGSLSTKAIRKIMPFLKAGHEYSEACSLAGYNHSHSLTKEEKEKRVLDDRLELLPKNSLRNPVVEKILNQMVNVINAIIDKYGKPDEIRIELARELKKSASERDEMTKSINSATKKHESIRIELSKLHPFNTGVRITRNDLIKYKLYEELAENGYKTIYTNTFIPKEKLFSKEFDIEHIIPKATLFDDSFSNKTLSTRKFNLKKGNTTGIDAINDKYGEDSTDSRNYLNRVEKLYADKAIGKAKYLKLKMTQSEIPDGFIERDIRNSQYIAKKARQMLEKIVMDVVPTTGKITDRLRQDWQLINVMQELNWDKYDKLGLVHFETNKDGDQIGKIDNWSKRNDHRHHAMDALTVAFTKRSHIQYFNNLNARSDRSSSIYGIEQNETYINDKGKRIINPPIPLVDFRGEAKNQLESILISFKAKNKVVTRNRNITKKKGGHHTKIELTPRGQLHEATIYGKSQYYTTKDEKVGPKFDEEKILLVAKKSHREALLKRLREFENNPKKAFGGKNSLTKSPIYLDKSHSGQLPERVILVSFTQHYTIRKDITPDNFKTPKNIEKVVDVGIRNILLNRLKKFDGNAKNAFANLNENPIWLNKKKGITIKRVTITGKSNTEALHYKKDHFGKDILDKNGKQIPVDFVSTGNNHHVAIYRDEKGNLHEDVVSFYKAVIRKNLGYPVIDQSFNNHLGWQFLFTMKQNEMFVFPNEKTGFNPNEVDLLNEKNSHLISPNLFRVQKISTKDYVFNHHYQTQAVNGDTLKNKLISKVTYYSIRSTKHLMNVVKVRINHLGQIVKVGEDKQPFSSPFQSINEPSSTYSKKITFHSSFDDQEMKQNNVESNLNPIERLNMTVDRIRKIYTEYTKDSSGNRRIKFMTDD